MATFMVKQYWPEIRTIATELVRAKHLDYDDVVGLVGGSTGAQPRRAGVGACCQFRRDGRTLRRVTPA
jgi:hypothetical protein